MTYHPAKAAAGKAAAALIQTNTIVGLGSGSTVFYFIEELAKRTAQGLAIQGVPTSESSRQLALEGHIALANLDKITEIDITVDGADEIDGKGRLVKGGGGALLREKIVAHMSKKYVVIADETKLVTHFGHFPLAVEIVPFCHRATIDRLQKMGYSGQLRTANQAPYITDNHNFIFDIALKAPCLNPEEDHERIRSVVGVVETGFFFNPVSVFLIGRPNGTVEERPKSH